MLRSEIPCETAEVFPMQKRFNRSRTSLGGEPSNWQRTDNSHALPTMNFYVQILFEPVVWRVRHQIGCDSHRSVGVV